MSGSSRSSLPLVARTEHLDPGAETWLAERCEVIHLPTDVSEFPVAAPHLQGLIVRTYTVVDNALLDRLPSLRVVGRAGVGLDNIDVEHAVDARQRHH